VLETRCSCYHLSITDPPGDFMKSTGTGIAIGTAIGAGIGAAMGNLGAGIAIGIAIGAALGATRRRREAEDG